MSVTLPLCLLVCNSSGINHSTSSTPQEPTGSSKVGSLIVACSAAYGSPARATPVNFNACEACAFPREDVIRGFMTAQSQHLDEVCSTQNSSSNRRSGGVSPAANTCPGFPGKQQTATSFADNKMETSPNNEGSKGNCPKESKTTTDTNRGTNERKDEVAWLTPFFAVDDDNSDEIDVTEEILASLSCLSNELDELRDHEGLSPRSAYGLDGAIILNHFLNSNCDSFRMIKLEDAIAEVAPEISPHECFSRLRSAGILSNRRADWNEAIGAPVESVYLVNCLRIMRNQRGGLALRIQAYIAEGAKEWLKDILETIENLEHKNEASFVVRNLTKGKKN